MRNLYDTNYMLYVYNEQITKSHFISNDTDMQSPSNAVPKQYSNLKNEFVNKNMINNLI